MILDMNNVSKKAARHDKRAKKQDERRGGKGAQEPRQRILQKQV